MGKTALQVTMYYTPEYSIAGAFFHIGSTFTSQGTLNQVLCTEYFCNVLNLSKVKVSFLDNIPPLCFYISLQAQITFYLNLSTRFFNALSIGVYDGTASLTSD